MNQIENAKNELERIFDSVPDLICVLDKNYKIVRANKAFCSKTNLTEKECIGKRCYELLHNTKECVANCPVKTYFKTKEIREIEVQEPVGEYKISIYPLYCQDGDLESIVHVAHDISHRKMYENKLKITLEKLQESNKDLEEFAYVASHDLQEPLRKVITFSTLIQDRLKENIDQDEEIKSYFERMILATKRMRYLIDDLLQYSRIATNENHFETIDLNATINDLIENVFDEQIEKTKTNITIENLPIIEGDKTQITQLFQNIISNCFKFKSKKKTLNIEIKCMVLESEDFCKISIKDNGIGFDNIYNKKIFDTFQRLNSKEKYKGSGIGLSICKRIVNRHKGEIYANSEVNNGATFFIELPLLQIGNFIDDQKNSGSNCRRRC